MGHDRGPDLLFEACRDAHAFLTGGFLMLSRSVVSNRKRDPANLREAEIQRLLALCIEQGLISGVEPPPRWRSIRPGDLR